MSENFTAITFTFARQALKALLPHRSHDLQAAPFFNGIGQRRLLKRIIVRFKFTGSDHTKQHMDFFFCI